MTNPQPPQELPQGEKPKSKFFRFTSHPVVVILSFLSAIIGLIGLPLSFYFYFASKEYPQLAYYAHPVKATIVRAGEASRLSTSFDNNPVGTDITAAQVAIWNQGSRPIKREQILRPVVITTEKNIPILEATIRKVSREVTQFTLDTSELQQGRLTILWNILEQNDGGVVQLIYAGNPDVRISVDGIIEGQPQIERLEFTGTIKSPHEQYESERWGYRGWGGMLFVLGILLLVVAWGIRTAKADYGQSSTRYLKFFENYIGSYERRIEWENKEIATLEKYIADFEQRIKEAEKIAADEGMDVEKLIELPNKWIEGYRKNQQRCREQIKEYELQIDKEVAGKAKAIQDTRKEERRFNIALLGIIALALLVFVPGVYLIFIAQPVGPPFGF